MVIQKTSEQEHGSWWEVVCGSSGTTRPQAGTVPGTPCPGHHNWPSQHSPAPAMGLGTCPTPATGMSHALAWLTGETLQVA